jgi:hypothetical protein
MSSDIYDAQLKSNTARRISLNAVRYLTSEGFIEGTEDGFAPHYSSTRKADAPPFQKVVELD